MFPNSATISCSSNDYASVDVECSNADVVDVGHTGEREVLGSNEREVLGMLACSRRVQEPVHSKVPEQVQVHSKLVLVQEPVHSKVLVQGQEQVHSKGLVLGKLACSIAGASDD